MRCTSLTISLILVLPLARYIWYRWLYSMDTNIFTIFYILSECIIIIIGCINMCILMNGILSNDDRIPNLKLKEFSHVDLPDILIIVPTYNESIDVIGNTLNKIINIEYPRDKMTIVVGDDGKRQYMKEFINGYDGIFYHTRKKIVGHAKAGNINDILMATTGDNHKLYDGTFVLILDCDMAPEKDILHSMIPYFYNQIHERDEKCCFVQSPQYFCNISGYDFMGQHYHFFYNIVMNAYNGCGLGVPCCGTNVIFDRQILESIGGLQYGSVTEDFHTSMILHSMGYHSKYFNKKTAVGLAPTSLTDFYKQRQRWTTGGLQIIFSVPSYRRVFWKLPMTYRWIYGFSGASCIMSIFMIFLMIGPIIDLFGYRLCMTQMSLVSYLYNFGPYALIYTLCLLFLNRKTTVAVFLTSMFESIFMIPFQFYYSVNFLLRHVFGCQHISFRHTGRRNIKFSITPKSDSAMNCIHIIDTMKLLFPFLFYTGVGVYSVVYQSSSGHLQNDYYLDIFWLVFIIVQLIQPVLYVLQNAVLHIFS